MKRQNRFRQDAQVVLALVSVIFLASVTFSVPTPAYAAFATTYAEPAPGNCGGNLPCYTTITAALNNVDPNGTVYVYAGTFSESVSLANGVTVILSGTVAVSGDLSIGAGTTLNSTATTFNLSGNWTNSGTFNHNNGTVRLNGSSVTQTISGNTTFYNLTLANSGATTDLGTSSLTIASTLSAMAGSMQGGTSTVTFTGAAGSISGVSSKRFYNLVINSGANISHSAGSLYLTGNFTNNGTFTQGSGITTYFDAASGTQTLSGTGTTIWGSVSVRAGPTVNAGSHNFVVCGSTFSVSGGGAFNGGTATVTIDGTTALDNAGTYNFNGITINTGKSLSNPNSRNFSVSGNWTNNGTFSSGTNTVTFTGTSQALTGNTTFNNLTTNAGATLDTGTSLITVTSTLANNGALKHTTPAQNVTNGGGAFNFVDAVNKTTVQLTQTGGSNMGDTMLVVTAHITPTNYTCGSTTLGGTPVRRSFNITPTNTSGVAATLRLYYYEGAGGAGDEANGNTLSNIAIYHCNGTNWERWTSGVTTGTDGTYKYIELANVTSFSPFGIGGGTGAPTAVTLSDFSARAEEDRTGLAITFGALGAIMLGALAIVFVRRA